MVIKYKTNRKGAPLHLSILLAVFVALACSGPNTNHKAHDLLVCAACCCLLSLWFFFGKFILANDDGIYSVDVFVFKRGLHFKDIQEVWYYQAYVTGGRTRILAIKGTHDGKEQIVKLAGNKFFSAQTLSDIVFLIQKRNPKVRLDGASEELVRNHGVMLV
jgi:hypothetical protein